MKYADVIIVGGGAAGYFSAINIAEKNPNLSILILEKSKEVLQKVRVSGGGRCNVTHACFEPKPLTKFYPRGERELIGPFHQFCAGDTVAWFEQRGVTLKIEEDGRMFPETDSSETIIKCLMKAASKNKIQLVLNSRVDELISPKEEKDLWKIMAGKEIYKCKSIVMASGSNPKVWKILENLNHQIVAPVPSLFTFNIKDERIKDLMGISLPNAHVKVMGEKLEANGPLLITHWGLSGPGILRLSAWGANKLNALKYHFKISVNSVFPISNEEVSEKLNELKIQNAKQKISTQTPFNLPKRLWAKMLEASEISIEKRWADINKKMMQNLAKEITNATFEVKGKSTFKEEFVTAGGVDLREVNMKTFESKLYPNLFFAGEILNIDAITGGFNFQAAWTGGWIVSENIVY